MAKILVIDDDSHIRKLYGEYLLRNNHQATAVSSGDEAYDKLKADSFDLIILDVELDMESGLELLKKIKIDYPDMPVILNSAYSIYKSDFSTWLADAYILKSSDIDPLFNKINQMVGA